MKKNPNKEVIKKYFGVSDSIEPLKFKRSKKMVETYKKATHHYLGQVTRVDKQVLDEITTILNSPSSYEHLPEEFAQIKRSIGHFLGDD